MTTERHGLLHVIQASYGDALMLEYDAVRKKDSNTIKFMLIDGGPPGSRRYAVKPEVGRPKFNLFYLLNELSKAHDPVYDYGVLQFIDTLVLTHDDDDHYTGIESLFTTLLAELPDPITGSKPKTDKYNSWLFGDTQVRNTTSPIKNIWYNSLSNLLDALGKAKEDGWFDVQLDTYKALGLRSSPTSFNANLGSSSLNRVKVAMRDAQSSTGLPVVSAQFTISFIGPPEDLLKTQGTKLCGALSEKDKALSEYKYIEAISKKTDDAPSIKKIANLGNTSRSISRDSGIKNRSSIAFVAADTDKNLSILLLGDSNAEMFYEDFKKNDRSDRYYDVMKVMHHGSPFNNIWSEDEKRKEETAKLPSDRQTIGLTSAERKSVFFFAKVRARKYVISASTLNRHPNPHAVTMVGIIAAAREVDKSVRIYLTNQLSPYVIARIAKVLRDNGMDLALVEIRMLTPESHSGTLDLYSVKSEDDRNWEEVDKSGKDYWSTYAPQLKDKYPAIGALDTGYNLLPPGFKRKPLGEIGYPSSIQDPYATAIISSMEYGHSVLGQVYSVSLVVGGQAGSRSLLLSPHTNPSTSPIISARTPPDTRTVSSMLFGYTMRTSHTHLLLNQTFPTKTFSDLHGTLQFLVQQGSISSIDAQNYENEASVGNGYNLAALLTLFVGVAESENILAAFPCTLASSTDYLNMQSSPSSWTVINYSAQFVDSTDSAFQGWKGLYSISFTVAPPEGDDFSWKLPFGTASPAQSSNVYEFRHDGAMTILILWPAYLMRVISGAYKGILQLAEKEYNIVGELSMLYEQPARYAMKFADSNYVTDDYTVSIGDILRLFNTTFDFLGNLASIVVPGLEHVLDGLGDSVALHEGEFVLEKILSRVVLKQISGVFSFNDIPNWQPFGSKRFSFDVSQLRVILDGIYSVRNSRLALQLDGNMNCTGSSNAIVTIPFELSASFTLQGFMLYEVAILPGLDDSVNISQIFNILGLPAVDLAATFPAVSNLSNSLSLSHLIAGWSDKIIPDYFTLTVLVSDWTVIKDKLVIRSGGLQVQASDLTSDKMSLSLHGWGFLRINQIEFEIYFNMSHGGSDAGAATDVISFQIATEQRPLRLGSIIEHFLGSGFAIFPETFVTLLDETAIESFILQASRDQTGWSLSLIELNIRIEGKLDILEGFGIDHPTLSISIAYPLDKSRRTVYVSLDLMLDINDMSYPVSVLLTSEEQTQIILAFDAGNQPLSLDVLATTFIPGYDGLTLPPALTFLAGIGLERANLIFDIANGRLSFSQILFSVVSTSTLQLWQEITLEKVSLFFSYVKGAGKNIEFHAMLSFANDTDFLDFTLVYDDQSSAPLFQQNTRDTGIVTLAGGCWSASASYSGNISTFDILDRISGINLRQSFDSVSLKSLANVLDISLSNLAVSLTKNSSTTEFSFDADTDWLFFSHLRLYCSKSTSWSYSFGFILKPDVDLISYIPVFGPLVEDMILFTDVAVVVFNGVMDKRSLPSTLNIPGTLSQGGSGLNVGFAGRLKFSDKLQTLGKAVSAVAIDILGIVGDDMIELSLSLPPVVLLEGKLTLTGSLFLRCSKQTDMKPEVGVQGDATLDFGPQVSDAPIHTSASLFVDFGTGAIGFEFTLDRWAAVFGFIGFNLENLYFYAEFPPEEFPVPSDMSMKGHVELEVNQAKFDGSVDFRFYEMDLMKSHAAGNIKGLTLNNIISAFSDVDTVPDYLDIGFGLLDYKIVPSDVYDSKGQLVMKKEFSMSGSFHLNPVQFEAAGSVDITPAKVSVDGHLSPIIVLDKDLFSILASEKDTKTGASIYVSVHDKDTPFGVKISSRTTFLTITNDVYFDLSSDGLRFSILRGWASQNGGSLSGVVDISHLELHAGYTFKLDINIQPLWIGSVSLGDVEIASFTASMDLNVDWSAISWHLHISGEVDVFGLTLQVSFTVGADILDLKNLALAIASHIESWISQGVVNGFRALVDDLDKVLTMLKNIGMAVQDMAKFLVESCEVAVDKVIGALKNLFGLAWSTLTDIMKYIGSAAQEVVDMLKDLGCEVLTIARSIADAFGRAVHDLCGKILKEAESYLNEIAQFFKDDFDDSAENVVGMLLSLGFEPWDMVSVIVDIFDLPLVVVIKLVIMTDFIRIIFGSDSKKTTEQVQDELTLQLLSNLAAEMSVAVDTSDSTQLPSLLRQYAMSEFENRITFAYNGVNTVPPRAASPPAVQSLNDMCTFSDGSASHITDFMDQMLEAMHLKSWMKDAAAKDVKTWTDGIMNDDSDKMWQSIEFSHAYNSSDDTQNSIKTDAVLIFVNGSMSDSGIDVTQTFLYYVGIYYDVPSPSKLVRADLRKEAYDSASRIMNNDQAITDDDGLTAALVKYGETLFRQEFLFDYGSAPPDYDGEGTFMRVQTNGLGYFEDKHTDKVDAFVRTKLFGSITLPGWVSDTAVGHVINAFSEDITKSTDVLWENVNIKHEYGAYQDQNNPVKVRGIVIDFTKTRTPHDEPSSVAIAYTFFIGMYYEVRPIKSIIYSDLMKTLFDSLALQEKNIHHDDLTPDAAGLEAFLDRAALDQFSDRYDYDYADWSTKPPDATNDGLSTSKAFCVFEEATADAISSWTSENIFRKNVFPFFEKVPQICSDLNDMLTYDFQMAGDDGSRNSWQKKPYTTYYDHPSDDQKILKVSAYLIYTSGYLSESEESVTRHVLQFVGIFYVAKNPDTDTDDHL